MSGRTDEQLGPIGGAEPSRADERGDDALDGLVDDAAAEGVVALEHVGAHEGENGHDILDHLLRQERGELRNEQQRLVRRLRIRHD